MKKRNYGAGGGGQASPAGGWTNTYDWGDYIG